MRAISVSRPSKGGALDRGMRVRCFCWGNADFFGRFAILGLRSTGDKPNPVRGRTLSCGSHETRTGPTCAVVPGRSRTDGNFGCVCGANHLITLPFLKVGFVGRTVARSEQALFIDTNVDRSDRRRGVPAQLGARLSMLDFG